MVASSYFSVITPQGGSQNIIFVGAGYLKQAELYGLGLLTTIFYMLVFLTVGIAWILLVSGAKACGPSAHKCTARRGIVAVFRSRMSLWGARGILAS
jgi:Sodium:sulfate symporter transmembrane region